MNNTIAANMVAILILAWLSTTALAQDISGTWEGVLEAAPDTEITVRFDLSADESGSYQAVLNSPDAGAIKNIQADSVSFNGTQLAIEVPGLSGSYQGAWDGEGFEGEWQQPGAVLPMNLKPYVATEISQETIDTLLGQWSGKLQVPAGEYNILFNFEMDETGEFTGAIQNVDTDSEPWEITDIRLEQGELFFRIPEINAEYQGTLSDDTVTGNWIQGGQSLVLNVSRGAYEPLVPELALSDADMEILAGAWSGALGPLTIVFNFERNADGVIVATIDSPDQGAMGLQVSEASVTNGRLDMEVAIGAQFSGQIHENTINGEWTQGGTSNPLNLTRQE